MQWRFLVFWRFIPTFSLIDVFECWCFMPWPFYPLTILKVNVFYFDVLCLYVFPCWHFCLDVYMLSLMYRCSPWCFYAPHDVYMLPLIYIYAPLIYICSPWCIYAPLDVYMLPLIYICSPGLDVYMLPLIYIYVNCIKVEKRRLLQAKF